MTMKPCENIYIIYSFLFCMTIDSSPPQLGIISSILQLLAGQHQSSDAADVARPPGSRAQIAQTGRLNARVQHAERDTRQRVPHTDGVDLLIRNAGDNGENHCQC